MRMSGAKYAFFAAATLFVAAAFVVIGAYELNRPTALIMDQGMVFTVERGRSLSAISQALRDRGAIKSARFLEAVSRLKGTDASFQAGTYFIEPETTSIGIHNLLVSGREVLQRVTIPEGWTGSQIAERLGSVGLTDPESFLEALRSPEVLEAHGLSTDSADGFLFPDTYFFPRRYPAGKIVDTMVGNFFEQLADIQPEYESLSSKDLYEKVIVASIIEREYRVPDEADLMASVFYNRLAIDMKLQSCATVAYVLTEEMGGEYPEMLTFRDLEVDSAYNTYLNEGLPPGPISNPGATALGAAFHPAKSDYLFFVLQDADAGRHVFSRSFNEHARAKNLYLKGS